MITIYRLYNTETSQTYVGQTRNFRRRRGHHHWVLTRGSHRNKWLQQDYDQSGWGVFAFEVLERCPDDEALDRERHWIDHYKANCYNDKNWRPPSKMKRMPSILNRIRRRALKKAAE